MTEKEKMLSSELYDAGDPELIQIRRRVRLLCEKFNRSSISKPLQRQKLIRHIFGSCGESINVEPDFHCDYGQNIHVGNNFYANFGLVILDVAEVRIGANCMIAPQVGIYTATHPLDPLARNSGLEYAKAITIGDNCWIGGHATINPGVTLGNNVVVASGAVVTKSFGDNVVLAGCPAKVIQNIPR